MRLFLWLTVAGLVWQVAADATPDSGSEAKKTKKAKKKKGKEQPLVEAPPPQPEPPRVILEGIGAACTNLQNEGFSMSNMLSLGLVFLKEIQRNPILQMVLGGLGLLALIRRLLARWRDKKQHDKLL